MTRKLISIAATLVILAATAIAAPDAETAAHRPVRLEPILDAFTLTEVKRMRELLPGWLRRMLGALDDEKGGSGQEVRPMGDAPVTG